MVLEQTINMKQKISSDFLPNWYRSAERAKYPRPKKLRVECSLDEDVIRWLEGKTDENEEYPIYINHYLRKIMDAGQ